MNWIYLAIAAYFFWGFVNITDKILVTKYIKDYLGLTFLSSFIAAILAVGYIIIAHHEISLLSLKMSGIALAAGAAAVGAYIFYYKALTSEEVSRVTIFWQTAPIFTFIFAFLFIGEKLTWISFSAFIILVLAGFLASIKYSEERKHHFHFSDALKFMILASLMIAASNVLSKFIFNDTNTWNGIFWISLGKIIPVILVTIIFGKNIIKLFLSSNNVGKVLLLGGELINTSSTILWLIALSAGSVSIISALSAVNPTSVFFLMIILSLFLPSIIKEETNFKNIILKLASLILIIVSVILLNLY